MKIECEFISQKVWLENGWKSDFRDFQLMKWRDWIDDSAKNKHKNIY